MKIKIYVVIPNINGQETVGKAVDSLLIQSQETQVIVVDNGSSDSSVLYLKENYPDITLLEQTKNLGFAGGVNVGIRYAIDNKADYIGLLNNDAVADKDWLKNLARKLGSNEKIGIATCKLLDADGTKLDSTGEMYTVWGLPFPRGRGQPAHQETSQHNHPPSYQHSQVCWYDEYSSKDIFAASGGASLYRTKMLKEIGLFDEDFFAYYEDVDISFRAQLAGWKIKYIPDAIAYHQIGATSGKIKGFTTYQTLKNLPMLLVKNVPRKYLFKVGRRYLLAHILFFASAVSRGQGWPALKGDAKGTLLLFTALAKRRQIQKTKKVSDEYIWNIMTHDLPPNAHRLRKLRKIYRKLQPIK